MAADKGTALAVVRGQEQALAQAETAWTQQQEMVLRETYAKGLTDAEFDLYAQVCRRTRLDPFRKQIYAIKRPTWDQETRQRVEKVTFQTGIDGYRAIAARTGLDDGQSPPQWCGEDGRWRDIWTGDGPPFAARVMVYKKGCAHPFPGVARWDAYAQRKRDGGLVDMWSRMGPEQLAKCAEALALRKAFPEDLGGVYVAEEMGQADNPSPRRGRREPEHDPETGEVASESRLDVRVFDDLVASLSTALDLRAWGKLVKTAYDQRALNEEQRLALANMYEAEKKRRAAPKSDPPPARESGDDSDEEDTRDLDPLREDGL